MFWALVLLLAAGGAATLQMLGAPQHELAAAPATPPAAPPAAPRPAAADGRIPGPDPTLLETSRLFQPSMLPRIAADGRLPRQAYARRFDVADARPRIGLILGGIGRSEAESRAAIDSTPAGVTLAFSAYATNTDSLLEAARARGHELLVSIPMEPQGFPLNDAGARSLLTGADAAANRQNLEWALSRMQGYVGATGSSDGLRGERFAEMGTAMTPLLEELGRRGLLYVDPRPGKTLTFPAGLTGRGVDLVVDDPPARAEIEGKLAALERLARERGSALGLAGQPRPLTVERVAAWARGLEERGFVLAPVSALLPPPQGAAR